MKQAGVSSALVAVMLLAAGVIAEAQQATKIWRIGCLTSGSTVTESARAEGTRLALRERGYIEGQNIVTEYRYAEGKFDRAPELAADLVRLKVDVIVVTGGTRWVEAVRNATRTIPIIMAGGGIDPIEAGLIESLARPGGNVTGLITLVGELNGKRLELLKEAVPKLARVAVLYDPDRTGNVGELKEMQTVARALKLTIQGWAVRGADGFEKVFAAMGKQRPDGLYVLQGRLMTLNQKRITDFALKSRLPSMYVNREYAEAGGLMYYGADLSENYRLVAWYIDKILKCNKPTDLPVQQPTKFEFVINLQTAKQIGLAIPPDLLARATKIIR